MNVTYNVAERTTGDHITINDEFHLLFDSNYWEAVELFPLIGNYKYLSLSNMGYCGNNLNYNESLIKPTYVLHCQDLEGKEVLIPIAELKVYATQAIQYEWGVRSTIFFWHIKTGTTFFLNDDFCWDGLGHQDEDQELINNEPLYALPLKGKESEVIDKYHIFFHNKRWFQLQGLITDKDW